jgi:hypothetical protein
VYIPAGGACTTGLSTALDALKPVVHTFFAEPCSELKVSVGVEHG